MGEQTSSLRKVLEEQKQLVKQYEALVTEYETSDIINENKKLKQQLEKLQEIHKALDEEYGKVKKEADSLKWALKEQIISEKNSLINKSEEKANLYFKDECDTTINQLAKINVNAVEALNKLTEKTKIELQAESKEYLQEIGELRVAIEGKIKEKRAAYREEEEKIAGNMGAAYQQLKEQPVPEEVMQKRIKANNMEVKIGLNWINKAGILLILIGIVTVMRYSFENYFTPEVKGIFGLILGIIFLLGGEYWARKDKRIFSQGMIGGGIGILYITIFCSYFILKILSSPIALLLAVLISVAAFVLCLRYNARTIGCFALIGGYMPLLACSLIDEGIVGNLVYMSMGYVLLLNCVTLFISMKKDWPVLQYLSFITNIPVAISLAFIAENSMIAIGYSFMTFVIYMLIILMALLKDNKKVAGGKIIVICVNTVTSCGVIWQLFTKAGLDDWLGLLALGFCICYYLLGKLIEQRASKEQSLQMIFNITALTFAILVMPVQFDVKYLSLGWLVEGLLLIIYGLKMKSKKLEYAGRIIFGLCLVAFYYDIAGFFFINRTFYNIKYTCMIVGTIGVLVLYIFKHREEIETGAFTNEGFITYKYFAIFSVWIYLVRMGNLLIEQWNMLSSTTVPVQVLLVSIISAILLTLMNRIRWLYDKQIKYVVLVGCCIVDLLGIMCNFNSYIYSVAGNKPEVLFMPMLIMILWNILILINIGRVVRFIVVKKTLSVEYFPFVLALAIITDMTLILGIQFDLGIGSVVISIFYVVCAFAMVGVGFKYAYRWIRYFGLALSLFALGKLFLFDFTIGVSVGYKIISYFGFGMVLLVMSYLYQKFSKMLDTETAVTLNRKEKAGENEDEE